MSFLNSEISTYVFKINIYFLEKYIISSKKFCYVNVWDCIRTINKDEEEPGHTVVYML